MNENLLSKPAAPGLDPTICADLSMNQLSDAVPSIGPFRPHDLAWALALPCRYCGHGHCLAGHPCQWCQMEIRIRAIEAKRP